MHILDTKLIIFKMSLVFISSSSIQLLCVKCYTGTSLSHNPNKCSALLLVGLHSEDMVFWRFLPKALFLSWPSDRLAFGRHALLIFLAKKSSMLYKSQVCQNCDFSVDGSDGKNSACNAEDLCSIPGSGRPPREGNGNLHQYS